MFLLCYGGPLDGQMIEEGTHDLETIYVTEIIYENVARMSDAVEKVHKYRKGTNDYDIEGWIYEGAT